MRRYRQVHVTGASMAPTMTTGDTVLARLGAPVRAGDLVLVR